MIAQVKDVLKWHYRSTQVGAISHAREETNPFFKVVWLVIFLCGFVITNVLMLDLMSKIQMYEVNTAVNVEKRSFVEFPAITVCNKNLIHCQHLLNMILECENNSSTCQKLELYCNFYVLGNCKSTPVVGGDGHLVCNGHSPEIVTNYSLLYDIQTDRMRQFHYWYSDLTTTEMKKLAHQPQDFILDCSFTMMKTTLL